MNSVKKNIESTIYKLNDRPKNAKMENIARGILQIVIKVNLRRRTLIIGFSGNQTNFGL